MLSTNAVGDFCGGNEKAEDDVEDDNGDGYDHDSVCGAGGTQTLYRPV